MEAKPQRSDITCRLGLEFKLLPLLSASEANDTSAREKHTRTQVSLNGGVTLLSALKFCPKKTSVDLIKTVMAVHMFCDYFYF